MPTNTSLITDALKAAAIVAPRAGAWIETVDKNKILIGIVRRTPCGCVD